MGAAHNLRLMLDQCGAPNLAGDAYNAGPGAVRAAGNITSNNETPGYLRSVVNFKRNTQALWDYPRGHLPQSR